MAKTGKFVNLCNKWMVLVSGTPTVNDVVTVTRKNKTKTEVILTKIDRPWNGKTACLFTERRAVNAATASDPFAGIPGSFRPQAIAGKAPAYVINRMARRAVGRDFDPSDMDDYLGR